MRTKYICKLRSTLQIYEGLYIIMLPHNWMLMHLSERIQLYQKCCKINIIFFTKAFVTPTHTFPYWDNLILPFQIWPVLRPGIQSWYIERLWKLIWVKNILKVIGEVGMDFTISVFVEILIEFGKYWIRNQSK